VADGGEAGVGGVAGGSLEIAAALGVKLPPAFDMHAILDPRLMDQCAFNHSARNSPLYDR
jgi:hypothetical protein